MAEEWDRKQGIKGDDKLKKYRVKMMIIGICGIISLFGRMND